MAYHIIHGQAKRPPMKPGETAAITNDEGTGGEYTVCICSQSWASRIVSALKLLDEVEEASFRANIQFPPETATPLFNLPEKRNAR